MKCPPGRAAISLTAAALSVVAWNAGAMAAGQVDDDILKRLDALERRNEELERRNRDLAGEVATMKSDRGEQWLTEERAREIRAIVEDVLADSDGRASLRQDGMTAGWNDGFFLASPDGRFKLEIGGLLQTRYVWSSIPGEQDDAPVTDVKLNRNQFDLPNTELWFRGHVFGPAVQYMVKTRFTNNTAIFVGQQGPVNLGNGSGVLQLLDAWIRFNLDDNWSIRAGQFRAPYSREFLITEQYQMAVDRSVVDYHYGLGYTQGVELDFRNDQIHWLLAYTDGGTDNITGPALGTVGSLPENSPWNIQEDEFAVTTRLEWKPFGAWKDFMEMTSPMGRAQGWLLGAAFHYQQTRLPVLNSAFEASGQPYNAWYAWEVDTQYNFGGASLYAAFYYNYVDAPAVFNRLNFAVPTGINLGYVNAWGLVLQGAVYFAPKWEAFVRYELGNWRATNQDNLVVAFQSPAMLNMLTAGINWYLDGQDVKATLDFGWAFEAIDPAFTDIPAGWRPSSSGEFVLRTRVQLMF